MPLRPNLKPHQQAAVTAVGLAGIAEPEAFIRLVMKRAKLYRKRLVDRRYLTEYLFTCRTHAAGDKLARWLTESGFPVLRWLPAPSKGLRHSIYINPKQPTIVLHINGEDYAF